MQRKELGRKDTHQNSNRSYLIGGREGGVEFSHFILYTSVTFLFLNSENVCMN